MWASLLQYRADWKSLSDSHGFPKKRTGAQPENENELDGGKPDHITTEEGYRTTRAIAFRKRKKVEAPACEEILGFNGTKSVMTGDRKT